METREYALECPGREQFQKDVERAAEYASELDALRNSTVLVTGATGLIGGFLTRAILCANRVYGLNARVLAPVRSMERARQVLSGVLNREELSVFEADITRHLSIAGDVDFIVHGAGVTSSRLFVTEPVETIQAALRGTECVLELAREKKVRGMTYLSSMEAFGVTDPALPCVTEKQLGFIDLQSVRSCYSESKRMAECLCACYAAEYGVNVKCARLAQTFGAGVSRNESRVFMQFAVSALTGQDIVLHTKGESFGNYVYTSDAARAIFLLLTRGNPGEAYTVANDRACVPIAKLAEIASQTLSGSKSRVVFDIPENPMTYGYAPDVKMRLNADKLKSLGWEAEVELDEMLRRLGNDLRQMGGIV